MTSDMHKARRLAIPFAPSIRYRGFTGKQSTPFFVEVIGSGYSTLQPYYCTTCTSRRSTSIHLVKNEVTDGSPSLTTITTMPTDDSSTISNFTFRTILQIERRHYTLPDCSVQTSFL